MPVIRNMRSYIDAGGTMAPDEADELVAQAERAIGEGAFLFSLPQFLVTAVKQVT